MPEDIREFYRLWDQAQAKTDSQIVQSIESTPNLSSTVPATAQDFYYAYNSDQQSLLVEKDEEPYKIVKSANPISPENVGPDSALKPAWVNKDYLKNVVKLKNRLFDVENEMAALMGTMEGVFGEKNEKMQKLSNAAAALKVVIDEMSDGLGLEYEAEGSLWKTRKKSNK